MLFSDFVGNDEVKASLAEAMRTKKLPHAIIIEGAPGTGKKTLARLISGYCVCSSAKAPCSRCASCMKAEKGIHPDISVYDGSISGSLNIESIRGIRSSAYIKPNEAPKKVFLLFHCEKMLSAAQNALLKVLEEPPENVVFILTIDSASSLLSTVRSRSRILSLYPVGTDQAIAVLKERFPEKEEPDIIKAANSCEGIIGQAIQVLNGRSEETRLLAEDIFKAIHLSTEYTLLINTSKITQSRSFAVDVLDDLSNIAAECVRASVGVKEVSVLASETARKVSRKKLIRLQQRISAARDVLNTNVNLNLYSTWLCAALRNQ